MVKNLDDIQKLNQDGIDAALKAFGALTKGWQALAAELSDYSKKSFEQGAATTEKLFGVKTLDKALEIQSDYVKTAYDGYLSQASRVSEIVAATATEAYKPFEGVASRAGFSAAK